MFEDLDRARMQFNAWSGKAAIFADFDEMEVFCEVGINIPHSYSKQSIVRICSKGDLNSPNMKTGKERLLALINKKYQMYNSGEYELWQINDDYLFGELLT